MLKIYLWMSFVIVLSLYNLVYGFLPEHSRNAAGLKIAWILVASLLALISIGQTIREGLHYSYAVVSADGSVHQSKNFPWKIQKSEAEGLPVFILEEYYGDATSVKIRPQNKKVRTEIYNAMDGVAVKFLEGIPSTAKFKIEVKR